ncbi:MAG: DUF5667 domain-containing protein [bacterium]|nr:DUF5667 domain-containing protein [bacterium]
MNNNKEIKIIEMLRNLKDIPPSQDEKKFLENLKENISAYIATHPFENKKTQNFQNIRNNFFIYLKLAAGKARLVPRGALTAIIAIFVLGTSSIAIASQNSLPGEALYPIKILTEDVQSSLAFTAESKATVQSGFAAKRVAEVKAIMEKKDVNPETLDIALTNLQKNTGNTAAIIEKESQKGTDTAKLAKDISATLDKNTENLKQIFKDKNTSLEEEESKLKNKIKEAKKIDDQTSITSLNARLDETNSKRKSLESNWNENEKILNEDTDKIKKRTEEKRSQEHDKDQSQNNNEQKKDFSSKSKNNDENEEND